MVSCEASLLLQERMDALVDLFPVVTTVRSED